VECFVVRIQLTYDGYFVQFIADIRGARVRELEEKRINKEMANIRKKFKGVLSFVPDCLMFVDGVYRWRFGRIPEEEVRGIPDIFQSYFLQLFSILQICRKDYFHLYPWL